MNRAYIFPTLNSPRLTLRPLYIHDIDAVYAMRSDHRNNLFLDRAPCETKEEAVAFINSILSKTENSALKYWVITLNNADTVIGTLCLYNHDTDGQSCEIGFELLHGFQGQGYMSESIKAVIEFIKATSELKTIHACTHSLNNRSISLLKKFGFSETIQESNNEENLLFFTLDLSYQS